LRVLYVASDGRSGSTVVSGMLGNIPGMFPVGELRGIWHAVRLNERCGCGVPFAECSFWREVGDRAFGGWSEVDVDRALALDARLARHRGLIRTRLLSRRRTESLLIEEHCARLAAIYEAVQRVSNASVIVDISKDIPYAVLLSRTPGVELNILHLIRDSRGVAYSWSKANVTRPEYSNISELRDVPMARRPPVAAALGWAVRNTLIHLCAPRASERLRVRYESLVCEPVEYMSRIVQFALRSNSDLIRLPAVFREGAYISMPAHTLGGNPVRFARGKTSLTPDMAWRAKLPRGHRYVVTGLTLPWLIAYRTVFTGRASSNRGES
jgi:hypothetical protein